MKIKKMLVLSAAIVLGVNVCSARPAPPPPHHHHPAPMRHHPAPMHHHHHHHSGGAFAAGLGIGVIGGMIADSLRPTPVVVAQPAPVVVAQPAPVVVTTPAPVVVAPTPVYQQQNVWVPGQYVDQVQANGTVIRVWSPGHYEMRQVQVQ